MQKSANCYQYVSSAKLPSKLGQFQIHGFLDKSDGQDHVAITCGQWQEDQVVPLRIHSECLTGDALFSTRCDCGFQLEMALSHIAQAGKGAVLYLRQEGRGIGLLNKIRAYNLQDQGYDTVEANQHLGFDADLRDYHICQFMLQSLKIKRVELMTNNPKKQAALSSLGIDIVSRKPIDQGITPDNKNYIQTKTQKLGHQFDPNLFK